MTYQQERQMAGLLPPGYRCSAYWYAKNAGLDADLEFLREFGARAARIARWYGVPEWPRQPEGPFWVFYWPEWVFDAAVSDMIWAYGQPPPEVADLSDYPQRAQVAQAYQLDDLGQDARRERGEWGSHPGWANPYD